MAISTKREVYKKYSVNGSATSHFAFADTLAEAKRAGLVVAKKEAWRGKWNLLYISLHIQKQDAPGSMYYKHTGWNMYVPVRGSGATGERIVAEIKRRHGVAPMVWTRR